MIGYLIGLIAVIALVLSIICMTRCKTDKFGQQWCYYQIWDDKQQKYVDDPKRCTRSKDCNLNIADDSWENGKNCATFPWSLGCKNCCNKPKNSDDGYLNARCGVYTPR